MNFYLQVIILMISMIALYSFTVHLLFFLIRKYEDSKKGGTTA